MINADVNRRFEHDLSLQQVAGKSSSERAEEWAVGLLLFNKFPASHEAVCEAHAVFLKLQCANHPVAIEPVAVVKTFQLESGRAIQVVSAANKRGYMTFNLVDCISLFTRFE